MSTYTLTTGLVIREGQRTWRLERMLDGLKAVFVDLENGAPKTLTVAQLQRDLLAKRLQVVNEHPVAFAKLVDPEIKLVQTFDDLSERDRQEVTHRLRYVKHILRVGLRSGMRAGIDLALTRLDGTHPTSSSEKEMTMEFKVPSASSIMSWMRTFEQSGGNPLSLISKHGFRTSPRRVSQKVLQIARARIRNFYCSRQRPTAEHTKREIDKELAAEVARGSLDQDKAEISMATLRRLILDISPYDRCVARYGPSYARNKWRYSLAGVGAKRVHARYEIDHTILDVVVVHDQTGLPLGRPTITVVVDSHSGYIVGFYISFWGSGLATTCAALKVAIQPKDYLTESAGLTNRWLAFGIPELLVVDNGLEFHSRHFQAIAMHLSSDILYCAVRQPWLKPFVERAIGEINGYLPFQGRVEKKLTNYLPTNPDKASCITFGALCHGLLKAVVDVHPFEIDERRLVRGYDLYSEGLARQLTPALPTSVEELDIIVASTKSLMVGNEGVVSDYVRYNSTELNAMRHKVGLKFRATVKFNPEDMGHVYVQDPVEMGWLKVPSCQPNYTDGLSIVQHKAIRSLKKEELSRRNADEVLTKAKLELAEFWKSAVKSGTRMKGAHLRAMSGFTSNSVFKDSEPATSSKPPKENIVAKEELIQFPEEYETYEFA